MESLLRQVIAAKPDYHHAYNALGLLAGRTQYAIARGQELIQKALEFAPYDPFIQDSLGWVEFRMGNNAEAVKKSSRRPTKQNPTRRSQPISARCLWAMGQRDRAIVIWKKAGCSTPRTKRCSKPSSACA